MKAKAARKAAKDVQLLDTQVKQELISAPWKHAVAPVKRPPGLGLSLQPKMENPEADDEPVAGMPCSQAEKSGCFNEILGSSKKKLAENPRFSFLLASYPHVEVVCSGGRGAIWGV